MTRPEIGDCRYLVEYIDYALGIAAVKAGGGNIDRDSLWDHCDQDDITVNKEFPSKWRAVRWARRNKKLDAFHMPRIIEQTYQARPANSKHFATIAMWEVTGYWEMDGSTEIYTGYED